MSLTNSLMTNDQAPMTKHGRPHPHWSLGFGHWSFAFYFEYRNDANFFPASKTAFSIGNRSVEEPVQIPSQEAWSSMYCASSGVSMAAPWAMQISSGMIFLHLSWT